ncbi:hypothetical protein CTM97_18580 [Photobacterium phosphoreum]|uniref:Uncharacterized protein n=1 Tax=Photobacterium phosphoreum TaxID=659 RepID=A0A2T3JBQ3_PHOPO|nr:hypothetical protein [Photobacterium phosphoreum]PSU19945.1 hypothetical protein CTM96_20560 [Photobacterium phosphoreum]PSU38794.1 hypothetical protein CTM97_18580 [Photobacterium phosphoreum]PSU46283.1 hypothetical protein C9J18_20670 [Photobacterium phosphoreum]
MKNMNDLDKIITIASLVAAKRRGMSVSAAKNLLQLGIEPTRANATLLHRQQTPKKLENM